LHGGRIKDTDEREEGPRRGRSTCHSRSGRGRTPRDIILAHDDVLSAIQFDLVAGILAEQDAVTGFDVEGDHFAVVQPLALPDGHHFTFLGFFLSRIGDDDAVARGFLFLDPLHHDAVV